MNALRLFFFAEFALIALVVPPCSIPGRLILSRLGRLVAAPILALLPLIGAVHLWLPAQSMLDVIVLQLLAIAFTLAAAGAALLAGRVFMYAGPLCVALVALAVLATPFWNNLLLNAGDERLAAAARQGLVVCNPLYCVAADLGQFDWMHTHVIYRSYGGYKLTRLGEDFAFSPARTWVLAIVYAALGLVTAGAAGLARPRGRPADCMIGPARFC